MENQDNILDSFPSGEDHGQKGSFANGVFRTVLYYASGLGLAALTYAIVGHPYIHAPGLHHWVIFMTFAGGLFWTLAALLKYFSGTRSSQQEGIILANTVAVVAFVLMLYVILHEESNDFAEEPDEVSMFQDGDTTMLYHNDKLFYMKVQDSVLVNLLDSGRTRVFFDSLRKPDKTQ